MKQSLIDYMHDDIFLIELLSLRNHVIDKSINFAL